MRDVESGAVGERVRESVDCMGDRSVGHAYLIERRRDPGWIAAYVVGALYLLMCVAYVTVTAMNR